MVLLRLKNDYGYHWLSPGTEDGGESKFGTQKKFIVLNKRVNVALISHVICQMASSFLRKILNNLQTGNGPGKERNQVITFFSFILNTSNTQSQSLLKDFAKYSRI